MHNTTQHDEWIAKVCDHLNKLIQTDYDAACTYREALLHVDDPAVRSDLHTFLGDHERHVMELTSIVRDLGGTPIPAHRDFKGRVLEGMTRFRSSRSTLGALRAMRTNEKVTNRAYEKAAEVYMPPLGQAIVMENQEDERRHLAAIEAHIDRLSGVVLYEVDRIDREASERRPYAPY
jgi:rubrerythrin